VDNPCATVTCDADKFCRDGQCIASCAGVSCQAGQICKAGACVASGCAVSCPHGQVCNPQSGNCQNEKCAIAGTICQSGQACDPLTGQCASDPCLGVKCPTGQACKDGECNTPQANDPDAGVVTPDHTKILATGQGGCACDAGSRGLAGGAAAGLAGLLGLLALTRLRRKPVRVRARRRP
jgi:hypothetical protein